MVGAGLAVQGWTTIKAKEEFQRIFQCGSRIAGQYIIMYSRAGEGERLYRLRVGIVCSRRVGKAVVRNRIRRLIKEAIRGQINKLERPADMVLVARPEAKEVDFWALKRDLEEIWLRAGLISD